MADRRHATGAPKGVPQTVPPRCVTLPAAPVKPLYRKDLRETASWEWFPASRATPSIAIKCMPTCSDRSKLDSTTSYCFRAQVHSRLLVMPDTSKTVCALCHACARLFGLL